MSLARRSKTPQSIDQLIGKLPGRPRSFDHVHINREGDKEYSLKATQPVLTPEARRITFAAYNIYVKAYNSKASVANLKIRKYNNQVQTFAEKEKPQNVDRIQAHFLSSHSHLYTWDYNVKVLEYNNTYGHPIIPQKKIQTIKQSTEKVFFTILWEYGNQLLKMKRTKEAAGLSYVREVYKIEVNTKHLENTKGEFGLYMLDYCPDTILNHKKRLMEAGVLMNSQYRGSERGTLHHINPQILVVFDDYDQKLVCADNQLLKITQPEVFRDTVLPTRSINKPKVKRDVHNFTSHDKDKAEMALNNALPAEDSTRAPSGKMKNPELANRAAKTGVAADTLDVKGSRCENSEFLTEKLVLPSDLANDLAAKKHENSDPLPLERLITETKTGTMSRSDFRELLIQDIFKQFSKIYRNHPDFQMFHPGVWFNSLKSWMLSRFLVDPRGHVFHKDKSLEWYNYLIATINSKDFGVIAVAKRSKFKASHISIYLNPESSTPGTFWYWYGQIRKNKPIKLKKESEISESVKKKAQLSKENTNHLRKLNKQMANFFNGQKIDDETLFRYVKNNMPLEIQKSFGKHFENFKNNINTENNG